MLITFGLLFLTLGIISSFFSSAETAFVCADKHALTSENNGKRKSAYMGVKLISNPTKLLSLVLMGNNLANVALAALVTLFTVRFFGESAVFVATILLTIIILVFFETIPKAFAVRFPNKIVLYYSYLLYPLQIVLGPFIWVINKVVVLFEKILFRANQDEGDEINFGRLRGAISDSRSILQGSHSDMLLGILDLDRIKVEEAMTPLSMIEGINLEDGEDDIFKVLSESKHSYLVVYKGNINEVLGFIDVKSALLMHNLSGFSKGKLKGLIEECDFIPDSVLLLNLMAKFTEMINPRAFVVDEYGEVQGIITLRDIIGKTMGLINSILMEELKPGVFRVNTSTPIREINKRTSWDLGGETLQVSTLRGLIQEQLESLPDGPVCLQMDDYMIETLGNINGVVSYAKIWKLDKVKD